MVRSDLCRITLRAEISEKRRELLRLIDVLVGTPAWRIAHLACHQPRVGSEHHERGHARQHHSENSLHERPPPSRKSVPVISGGSSSPSSRITVGPTSHSAPCFRSGDAPRSST